MRAPVHMRACRENGERGLRWRDAFNAHLSSATRCKSQRFIEPSLEAVRRNLTLFVKPTAVNGHACCESVCVGGCVGGWERGSAHAVICGCMCVRALNGLRFKESKFLSTSLG